MLKKMMFSNILSFKQTQFIEFEGTSNIYAIYGKNSAGKSNILMITKFLYETMYEKLEDIKNMSDFSCKFANDPVINIAAELILNGKEYFYTISVDTDEKKYLKQELIQKSDSFGDNTIFSYENDEFVSDVFNKTEKGIMKGFNIAKNGVFLYLEDMKQSDSVKELINISKLSDFQKTVNDEVRYLNDNKTVVHDIVNELKKIDTSIDDIEFLDRRKVKQNMLEDIEKAGEEKNDTVWNILNRLPDFELVTVHGEKQFTRNLESAGTNRYLDLLINYFVEDIHNTDVPRIIDELETHLHVDVFLKFIEFYSKNSNRQLIFTTHNQEILEKKILSKANIIVVDKEQNDSEVTLLSAFKELRSDDRHNWKKMYNKFMLGGKPNVL